MDRKSRCFRLGFCLAITAVLTAGCSHGGSQIDNAAPTAPIVAAGPPAGAPIPKEPTFEQAFNEHMEQTHGGAPPSATHN